MAGIGVKELGAFVGKMLREEGWLPPADAESLRSSLRAAEERARREGIEEAARLVDREGCRCTDCRLEPGLDMASRIRALSEREEG